MDSYDNCQSHPKSDRVFLAMMMMMMMMVVIVVILPVSEDALCVLRLHMLLPTSRGSACLAVDVPRHRRKHVMHTIPCLIKCCIIQSLRNLLTLILRSAAPPGLPKGHIAFALHVKWRLSRTSIFIA